MDDLGIAWILIVVANILVSLRGFRDYEFFNSWTFEVHKVIDQSQWYRILTSGFLHVSGTHLAFNMITLYFFAGAVEGNLGSLSFVVIYFGSLVGGNLLSLFIHRNNYLYRAVGASGAVSGVVFAAIALNPGMKLGLIFLPIFFPAWIYGLAFVLYSIYGIRSQRDNIGHEAHLGGAVVGLLIAIAYAPVVLRYNSLTIALILIPTIIFILAIIYRPDVLLINQKHQEYGNLEDTFNEERIAEMQELNKVLEKITKEGIESLTEDERELLDKFR